MLLLLILVQFLILVSSLDLSEEKVEFWLTTANKNQLMKKQPNLISFKSSSFDISISKSHKLQEMDGFGWCLTGGSAKLISELSPLTRNQLLENFFSPKNVGTSMIRISIGASDLDEKVFSYNDLNCGGRECTDPELKNFSLGYDFKYLIPIIKQILTINPKIKILGSPWSPPVWMKTVNSTIGGKLNPTWMGAYAKYFLKYIQEMEKENIHIWGITPQNEPLNPLNNPSLLMDSNTQLIFIRDHLGPIFKKANCKTKIIIYDHNADDINYPMHILANPQAAQYIDGSAFHLYAGSMSSLSEVHRRFPSKGIYFTEQWTEAPEDNNKFKGNFMWAVNNLIIDGPQNYCKAVLQWNLAIHAGDWKPHTDGGCTKCLGAISIRGSYIYYHSGYYAIVHASKFVIPGSVRIQSSNYKSYKHVTFLRPDGRIVIIITNNNEHQTQTLNIAIEGTDSTIKSVLPPLSVATYVWPAL